MPIAIQSPRFFEALRKYFGLVGVVSGQLIDDVIPTVDLANLRPALRYMTAELPWLGAGTAAAVAGQFGFAQLFVPYNSGLLVEVQSIYVGTADIYGLTVDVINHGAASNHTSQDTRTTGASRALYSTGTEVAGVGLQQLQLPAGFLPFPFVLTPGFGITLKRNTINAAVAVAIAWTERIAAPEELQRVV